jgi:hypothetical protein
MDETEEPRGVTLKRVEGIIATDKGKGASSQWLGSRINDSEIREKFFGTICS